MKSEQPPEFNDRSREAAPLIAAAWFAGVCVGEVRSAIRCGELCPSPAREDIAAWVESRRILPVRANALSPPLVRRFLRQGYVHLRSVLQGVERERLARECDALLRGPRSPSDPRWVFRQSEDGYVLERLRQVEEMAPAFRTLTAHPSVLRVAQTLFDGPFLVYGVSLVVKVPLIGLEIPPHRDPTWTTRTGPDPVATLGIYLDDSSDATGVYFLPGTHRLHDGRALPVSPGITQAAEVVRPSVRAGDAILHNLGVIHGSPAHRSQKLRRTIYCSLMSAREAYRSGRWSRCWIAERVAQSDRERVSP
jgi:hypothetical protein